MDDPWNLSYKKMHDARPSWSKHGMPSLFEEFMQFVKNKENPAGFHLDIGCGNGIKTVNFALSGLPTIGVDLSPDGFKEARELAKELSLKGKCKFKKANCLKFPFPRDSFSSASDILCLTHLKPADYLRYKRQLLKILKEKGYVLMVLFSDKDKHFHGHKVSKGYAFSFDPDNPLMEGLSHYHGMHNCHFSKKDIKNIFSEDFKIVSMLELDHPLYDYRKLWNVILQKV